MPKAGSSKSMSGQDHGPSEGCRGQLLLAFQLWELCAILNVCLLVDTSLQSLSSHGVLPVHDLCVCPHFPFVRTLVIKVHLNPQWPHLELGFSDL